jgi:hypothetical protein
VSIIRVKKISELEAMIEAIHFVVTVNVVLILPILFTLMMGAIRSSDTSVLK